MMRDTNTLVMQDQGEDLGSVVLSEEQKQAARRIVHRLAMNETDEEDLMYVLGLMELIEMPEEQA
jgi:hypothetical protein